MDAEKHEGPVIGFADVIGRSEQVALEWPITVDGVIINAITIKRMTVGDVAAWKKALAAAPTDEARGGVPLPMMFCPDGSPVTPALAAALDPDDDARLDEVIGRFLPQSLRPNAAEKA